MDEWADQARANTARLAGAGVAMAGYWDESWYAGLRALPGASCMETEHGRSI